MKMCREEKEEGAAWNYKGLKGFDHDSLLGGHVRHGQLGDPLTRDEVTA